MPRYERDDGVAGIALTAVAGFATGLMLGMIASEWAGNAPAARLAGLLRRLGGRRTEPALDPAELEAEVRAALQRHPDIRQLRVTVRSPGAGLVELTGAAPNAVARRTAGDIARGVPGADAVVNRLLVEGEDLPPRSRTTG